MLPKPAWIGLAVAFCAAAGGIAFWLSSPAFNAVTLLPQNAPAQSSLLTIAQQPSGPRLGVKPNLSPVTAADLDAVCRELNNGLDGNKGGKPLCESLGARLRAMPSTDAALVISHFLAGRRDAPTRLPFTVGKEGNLTTAPTLRVWLMDQLGRVSAEAAASYAAQILTKRESAEEWAVALRDYARIRTSPADVAFLRGKLRELLLEPRWQAERSVGWLEAFDVAVHIRATELTPELAALSRSLASEDKAVMRAACLTLDRMTLADPIIMLGRFLSEPELLKGRELARANYFARADVRDAPQRLIVERYFLDPARSPEELAKFAGLFPNANLVISRNLLTSTVAPTAEEWLARDSAALQVVSSWMADSRFSRVRPQVEAIHARLSAFVRDSSKLPARSGVTE